MKRDGRPNIVVFLADDMGYSDIGCYGGEIETPHIDAMAQSGLRYTQMYNNARCCPSRAALLTGLYPHQAGVGFMDGNLGRPAYQGYLNDQCITLAEGLKAQGYHTGMSGKWHVGGVYHKEQERNDFAGQPGYPTPMQRGFDRFYGILKGASNYYNPITLMEDGEWLRVPPEEDFYFTDDIAEKACGFVEDFRADNKPVFLYVSFTAPHWPLQARPGDIARYAGKYRAGWDEIRARRYARQLEMGLLSDLWDMSPRDSDAPAWAETPHREWEDLRMAIYAAQVTSMDQAIGKIVEKFRALGEEERTLFLFLSDNGACAEQLPERGWVEEIVTDTRDGRPVRIGNDPSITPGPEDTFMSYGLPWANASNTPFRLFKHWIHEGGISSPFVLQWKERVQDQGAMRHAPVHFVDIMPTLLEAAGAAYPAQHRGRPVTPMQGESLLPSVANEAWQRERPIFWEHEGNCGVRLGKWKLVRKYPGPFELYDMACDRTELHDRAGTYPEVAEALQRQYRAWAEATGVVDWDTLQHQ